MRVDDVDTALPRFLHECPEALTSRGTVTLLQALLLVFGTGLCARYLAPAVAYLVSATALAVVWLNRTERYVAVAADRLLLKPSALRTEIYVVPRKRIVNCVVTATSPWSLSPQPSLVLDLADGQRIIVCQLANTAQLARALTVPHRGLPARS
jgi:hypothetical protein